MFLYYLIFTENHAGLDDMGGFGDLLAAYYFAIAMVALIILILCILLVCCICNGSACGIALCCYTDSCCCKKKSKVDPQAYDIQNNELKSKTEPDELPSYNVLDEKANMYDNTAW